MKLSSGKRIGQSGQELVTATIFSFLLHGFVLAAAVFLYFTVTPKHYVPPFYEVKLVGQPVHVSEVQPSAPVPPAAQPAPEPPKPETKTPKQKKSVKARRASAKMKKGAMPDLALSKKKKEKTEAPNPAEQIEERKPAARDSRKDEAQPSTADSQGVVVAPVQDFKFGWYLAIVKEKIGRNWRPQISSEGAKARVIFSINRSGWVENPRLDEEHSTKDYSFKLAAIRAIQTSNPFPPLPEEFSKQTLEFSVDLTPKE